MGPAFESLPRTKPRAEYGAVGSGSTYGDLNVTAGSHGSLRGPEAACVEAFGEGVGFGRVRNPTQSGHRFRFDVGHGTDLIPATIPK